MHLHQNNGGESKTGLASQSAVLQCHRGKKLCLSKKRAFSILLGKKENLLLLHLAFFCAVARSSPEVPRRGGEEKLLNDHSGRREAERGAKGIRKGDFLGEGY